MKSGGNRNQQESEKEWREIKSRPYKIPAVPSAALLITLILLLSSSPSYGYFMTCEQFCSRLARDELQQLLCVYNMCRSGKLGDHLLRFAKRRPAESSDDFPPLTVSSSLENTLRQAIEKANKELAVRRPLPPVQEKRDIEYWDGPAPADMNA